MRKVRETLTNSANNTIIFRNHFHDFSMQYEEKYEKEYGKFRLERITHFAESLLTCGDYTNGVARIQCTDPDCRLEGGFDDTDNFILIPIADTAAITECFRRLIVLRIIFIVEPVGVKSTLLCVHENTQASG